MKRNLKRLALFAMLLSGSTVAQGDQTGLSVGDLPGYGETAYFHEDATYASGAEITPNYIGDSHVGDSHVGDLPPGMFPSAEVQTASHALPNLQGLPKPIPSTLRAVTQPLDGKLPRKIGALATLKGTSSVENCEPACDSSDSAKAAANTLSGRMAKRLQAGDYWMSSEALLWFTPNRSMPALITTSDPQTLPVLPEGGANNVQTVFGDDINGEVSGGIRLDFGKHVGENFSVGGRFWWLGNNDDSYFGSDNGSNMSIGRPFFNIGLQDDDALLVAIEPVGVNDGDFTGSIVGRSQLKLWAAEGYGRLSLAKVDGASIDLIGGYSHFSIDDMLSIQSETIDEQTARVRRYSDSYDIENEFNGGQIGFLLAMNHGRWSVNSLTKIHLGNMNQNVNISGSDFDQTAPAPANQYSDGMLTMGHTGQYERDTFSFVPEVNFKLGYSVRNNVNLTLGYSFIYFDNVALVGDVIDTSIEPLYLNTGLAGNGSRPAFDFDDSGLWVQGIDFGLSIDF